jgi:protein-tyrosine phosphatase
MERNLNWDGCFNVRDLGGLATRDGRWTRWGALVRSETPDRLTERGWSALLEHGVRTVIDLRNSDERAGHFVRCELDQVHVPVDPLDDHEFWGYWSAASGTPLYYRPFLDRAPRVVAGVLAAVAGARPGGVLIHCAGGRDRTGLMVVLLLALVGVPAESIADDYEVSMARMPALYAAWGTPNLEPVIASVLAERGTSARELILSMLGSLDVEAYARDAGLSEDQLGALRARLVTDTPRWSGCGR